MNVTSKFGNADVVESIGNLRAGQRVRVLHGDNHTCTVRAQDGTLVLVGKDKIKLDGNNMYGYLAYHNTGTTLVTSDGKVYERPYGRNRFFLAEENVDADEWADKASEEWGADWTYLEQEDIDELLGLDDDDE